MTIGMMGAIALIVLALALGIAAQIVGETHRRLEWLITGIAALIGGFVASEYLGTFSAYGPEFDGLAIVPALVGAFLVAVIADAFTRASVSEPAV